MNAIVSTLEAIRKFIVDHELTPGSGQDLPPVKNFVRDRILTFARTVGMSLNFLKRGTQDELITYFTEIGMPEKIPTASAFVQRRKLIDTLFYADLFRTTSGEFYSRPEQARTFNGLRVVALDGTTVWLPTTKENEEEFGKHRNNGKSEGTSVLPVAELAYDPLNDLFVDMLLAKSDTSELSCALEIVQRQPAGLLYLADGYYPSYAFMRSVMEKGGHFLLKAYPSWCKAAGEFWESGRRDGVITVKANFKGARRLKAAGMPCKIGEELKARAIRWESDGEGGRGCLLLTDLDDAHKWPADELARLYARRWSEETAIGYAKNEEQMTIFSGRATKVVRDDLWATLIDYNIMSLLEKVAPRDTPDDSSAKGKTKTKYEYEDNRNVAWAIMKIYLPKWLESSSPEQLVVEWATLMSHYKRPVRPHRHFPRHFLRRYGRYRTENNYRRAV